MEKRALTTLIFSLIATCLLSNMTASAQGGIELYTPYTKISVPPGESVDYSIEVRNNSNEIKNIDLSLTGLPKGWKGSLKAGNYSLSRLAVLPGDKKSISLKIEIPQKVNKGDHTFRLEAKNLAELPLCINISEQGTMETTFTCDQINLQGDSKANFTFSSKLKNQTGEDQVYALQANPPEGWSVIFKPNYKQATAVEISPNGTSSVSIEVKPPYNVSAGSYKIPVAATNRSTSANLELEVVVTGTSELELTTPTGLLSTKVTAGGESRVELSVINSGSAELNDISLKSANPANWTVSFTPSNIASLKPGERTQVFADIKAFDKAIPGDYALNFTAQTKDTNARAAFRATVKTPLLWGWVGILIIIATLGVIYYLFRKFGRR